MINQRYGHSLVTCNGRIYAIGGGKEPNDALNLVERLSDLDEEWEDVAPLNSPRKWLAAVSYNGLIYAVGSESGGSALKTVEKYDPDKNKWEIVENAEIDIERSQHTATVLDSKIFVVGGVSCDTTRVVEKMECFDPRSNKWIEDLSKNTPHKLHLHSTVAW